MHWIKPNGELKLASCQVALRRMEAHGVIWLPLPVQTPSPFKTPVFTAASDRQPLISGSREDLQVLRLVPVTPGANARLWTELMERHHYLGGRPMIGAQMRYLAYDGERVLAALGFGAAAWKLAPRDRFIGWTAAEREANLQLIVELRRFLILPWVEVKNLASALLAMAARRLSDDWEAKCAYRPVLLETFTERGRFTGTSYAAANWLCVGQTQGRGKLDRFKQGGKPIKDIWLYPLDRRFRSRLTGGRLPVEAAGAHVPSRQGGQR
ncbi:MAG: Druantia anti-phage system protein DruA [Caulobacteraceae bacterium]